MKKFTIAGSAAVLGIVALLPFAAFAQTTVGVTASTDASASTTPHTKGSGMSVTTAKSRADQEITRRLTSLNSLSTRVSQLKNVSASDKASLTASINTQITAMNTLKATIDAETVTANLKTEIESITKDYRIYMLIIPQGRITAASDRAITIVADMEALAPKLEARITADPGATGAASAYTDMQAKVADANTNASAAVSEVAALTPDQGNTSVATSNTAALKDGAAKMKVATSDLTTARADIGTILKAVEGNSMTGSTTSPT